MGNLMFLIAICSALFLSNMHGSVTVQTSSYLTRPYIVSLEANGEFLGNGAIVGGTWVLTASLCVYNVAEKQIIVRVGSDKWLEGGHVVNVRKIHLSNNQSVAAALRDLALVFTEQSFMSLPMTNMFFAILPAAGDTPSMNRDEVRLVGWGLAPADCYRSPFKHEMIVALMTKSHCDIAYHPLLAIHGCFLLGSVSDGCVGETAGLVLRGNTLIGIASYEESRTCLTEEQYGSYIRAWLRVGWILELIEMHATRI